jgi:hypothetical protein
MDAAFYQRLLDREPWSWDENRAGIFYSMSQTGFAYQIELIRPPGGRDELTIRFVKDGKAVCSWKGHSHSVFIQKGKTLVYALFHPSSQGCTLVAVDLERSAELWRNELKAIPRRAHSGYSNYVTLSGSDEVIAVNGNETFGKYVEIVSLKTGKSLAYRAYDKDAKDHPE